MSIKVNDEEVHGILANLIAFPIVVLTFLWLAITFLAVALVFLSPLILIVFLVNWVLSFL